MIKAFVQTGKSEYPCPECGGGMVTETIPFNVVVHKCLDCKTIHTKEYLAGWYDAANEFCNIKSESFGEFRSYIVTLESLLREAGDALEPIAKKDGVLDFVEIESLRRAAKVLRKIRALVTDTIGE